MHTKKHLTITIVVIVVAVVVSFYGGMLYGKSSSASSRFGGNLSEAQRAQFQGGAGGRSGQFGQGGGILSGDIVAKDNQSITLKTRDGSSHIIFYSTSTRVIKPSPASMDDVVNGISVLITGTANSDGSLTAQSIQVRGSQPQAQPQG
ncbi:MAG: hypothetical protein KGJ89_04100 [Patescibacteria group bacterium]|nr:hypothetical protein [Patescibacteria group bacterium]MDE2015308.1 hypothetical protein [Patescibacteria group bacterium]MDE2227113.1 hypothetical protein [Patescibacteria group bacterium]